MNYEKKYKEALERARQFSEHPLQEDSSNIVEYIFPELDESNDERIRKELIKHLKEGVEGYMPAGGSEDYARWLAWLEKQGEPIDINPSEFDLRLNKLLKQFESLPKEELASCLSFYLNVVQNDGTYKPDEKQGEQKPVWSEEDETKMRSALAFIKSEFPKKGDEEIMKDTIAWLKSLKHQNTWKPSKEQIEALHDLNLTGDISYMGQARLLIELYNGLKKLTE